MKLIITLNAFAILISFISAETARNPIEDVAIYLIINHTKTMLSLKEYGNNERAIVQIPINKMKMTNILFLKNCVEEELGHFLKKIYEDQKNGTAADNCYKSAESNFTAIIRSLNTSECEDVDFTSLPTAMAATMEVGEEILEKINGDITSCSSSDNEEFYICLNEKLLQWRNSTEIFLERVENFKNTSTSLGGTKMNDFTTTCFWEETKLAFRSFGEISSNALKCIAAIQ